MSCFHKEDLLSCDITWSFANCNLYILLYAWDQVKYNKIMTDLKRKISRMDQNSNPSLQIYALALYPLSHPDTNSWVKLEFFSFSFLFHSHCTFSKPDQTGPSCICMLYLYILWIKQIEEDLGIWALFPR